MIVVQYQEMTTVRVKRDGKEHEVPAVINVTETHWDNGRRDCNIHVPAIGAGTKVKEVSDG